MADTTVHYMTCNPETIWDGMLSIYAENGGDVLFPGDEKYILLRAVQQIIVAAYAAGDNAARMQTVRYAVGEYLDIVGEKMRMKRGAEECAETTLSLTLRPAYGTVTIPAGTLFSYNGMLMFETTEYAATLMDGQEVTLTVPARCTEGGEAGNGIKPGTVLQAVGATTSIAKAEIASLTAGGRNREEDEAFRQRLLASVFNDTVTGPEQQYRGKAMAVSSGIVDASAVADSQFAPGPPEIGTQYGLERGQVLVCLLFADSVTEEDKAAIILAVHEALNTDSERPLTDSLIVREADTSEFALKVRYMIQEDAPTDAVTDIMRAAEEYKAWQSGKIGRPFDPYKLTSMLYNAGCSRVEITEESTVDGGPAKYMPMPKTKRMKGTVTMEMIDDG